MRHNVLSANKQITQNQYSVHHFVTHITCTTYVIVTYISLVMYKLRLVYVILFSCLLHVYPVLCITGKVFCHVSGFTLLLQ